MASKRQECVGRNRKIIKIHDVATDMIEEESECNSESDIESVELTDMATQTVDPHVHSGHLIYSLKMQLQKKETAMHSYQKEYDNNLGKILSSLLFLEGQLHQEQKRISGIIKEKDMIIEKQEVQIKHLFNKNKTLLSSLNELHLRLGANGINQGLQENCTVPVEPSPKPPPLMVIPPKDRFRNLKERFGRHKGSVELRSFRLTNQDGRDLSFHSSMENLSLRRSEDKIKDRERCKSIAGYPNWENWSMLTSILEKVSSEGESCGLNETISSTEEPQNNQVTITPDLRKAEAELQPDKDVDLQDASKYLHWKKEPAHEPPSNSFSHVESNPFKSFKNALKRKGSKLKNKKRSFSLTQNNNGEYFKALKHNEGLDCS